MTKHHNTRCPYCLVGEPSVWDGVLEHYAHPDALPDKLKFCHEPWRERCRQCSADSAAPMALCSHPPAKVISAEAP